MNSSDTDKKSFTLDVTKLVSGTVIAQIIGFLITPIITRIFSPDIYGLASTFISVSTILLCISALRYEQCIIIPKDDEDGAALVYASSGILVIFSILSFIFLIVFGESIVNLFGVSQLYPLILLMPVYVLLSNFYQILRQWNTRRKRYTVQATTQVLQTITDSGSRLTFGLTGHIASISLVLSSIFGQFLSSLFLLFNVIRFDLSIFRKSLSIHSIYTNIVRYRKFPLVASWGALLNVISWNLPVLMLTSLFSSAVAGLYSLGFTIIQLPISLIANAIGQVFKQRASVAYHAGNLKNLVEDVVALLVVLSFGPFIVLGILGPELFSTFFGAEWYEAGVYTQLLAPFGCFLFISTVLNILVYVLEIQEVDLIMNLVLLPLRFISLAFGAYVGSIHLALILYSISSIIGFGYASYKSIQKSQASIWSIFSLVKGIIPIWGIIIVVLLISKMVVPVGMLSIVVAVIVVLLYYGYLWKKSGLVREFIGK